MVKKFVLQWHLSENCNLKCLHCYQENHKPIQLSYEQLEKIYKQYKNLLKKLKMIYPTIHFHIIVNNLEYIENLLLKNELDFALIETTPLHQLKKIAFYQDELVIIVRPKHPLLKVKDLKELEHYDYYSREKGSSIYELVHSYFISHDLDIVPTIECTNPHALIELVKQNDGFSILPYSLVKESKEITYLKNNDFQIQRTYHIVMHKDKKLLPLYQEIFELIKKE